MRGDRPPRPEAGTVLLDEVLERYISDFGLSWLPTEKTDELFGSAKQMAPEGLAKAGMARSSRPESDSYVFSVLITQLLAHKETMPFDHGETWQTLLDFAACFPPCWPCGTPEFLWTNVVTKC
jgi:serine/threonine protein kinase